MSVKMKPDDPAYWMLFDGVETTPTVYNPTCYICNDPEFAQMGLPLCRKCPVCGGHVAADDTKCDDCGANEMLWYESLEDDSITVEFLKSNLFLSTDYEPVVPSARQGALLDCALERISVT